jgi:hypothetical protein
MRISRGTYLGSIPLWAACLMLLSAACTDEKIVFREPVNPPPDANSGFLGYFSASDKQTTCGNCHIGHQRAWLNTAHADAYATLANSGGAQTVCYSCHTVSNKGNATAAPAGWESVPDTAYHDVQCESCHGPGFDHVQEPDAPVSANNPPLAHVGVLGDSATTAQSCADCHSGFHTPFAEEWSASAHAVSLQEDDGTFVNDASPTCGSCHEGRKALAAWGVTSNYAEKNLTGTDHYLGITCAVCHDPHGFARGSDGKPIAGQLRFPIDVPDVNQNLCMKCHQRRAEPDQASSRGPHSPQGPMLLGDAGYKPAGFDPDVQAVASTHGSERNPRLCAGCHVNRYTVNDPKTGNLAFQSVGHLFLPIPCLDAAGVPSTDRTCAYDPPSRTWGACTNSGCHADASTAAAVFASNRDLLDQLTKQIWDDKNGNDSLEAAPTDGGYLSDFTNVPPTEYVTGDNHITAAEGAQFNVRMLRPGPRELGGGVDGSSGVHNPFLARALLSADIAELRAAYPGLPQASAAVQGIMRKVEAINKRPLIRPSISRPLSSR